MKGYAIFDVEIHNLELYQEYMMKVKPLIEAKGGQYLARGGEHKVLEGDWQPRRIVLFEFPSMEAMDEFYHCPEYQELKPLRDKSSDSRIVTVQGM